MEEKRKKQIEENFYEWIKLMRPEKIQFNPKFIEIQNNKVIFGLTKHMGRMSISIDQINYDLEHKQDKIINETIIETKLEPEKRITEPSIKVTKHKQQPKKFSWGLIISYLFFAGIFTSMISLAYMTINVGYEESNFGAIIIGVIVASVALLFVGFSFFEEHSKITTILSYLFIISYFSFLVILAFALIFALFYLPFSSGINFNLDLGFLILKDNFIRLLLIAADIFILYNVYNHLKAKIKKHRNEKNYW